MKTCSGCAKRREYILALIRAAREKRQAEARRKAEQKK